MKELNGEPRTSANCAPAPPRKKKKNGVRWQIGSSCTAEAAKETTTPRSRQAAAGRRVARWYAREPRPRLHHGPAYAYPATLLTMRCEAGPGDSCSWGLSLFKP